MEITPSGGGGGGGGGGNWKAAAANCCSSTLGSRAISLPFVCGASPVVSTAFLSSSSLPTLSTAEESAVGAALTMAVEAEEVEWLSAAEEL